MVDPVSVNTVGPVRSVDLVSPTRSVGPATPESDFASVLRQQLEQVSQIQMEADQGVEDLLTGRTNSVTEVFVAARKAEMAFGLLMEIRNKLADAYLELRNMRV